MSRVDVDSIELFLQGLARHANPYRDGDTGIIYLSLPERIPSCEEYDDTQLHICKGGETLLGLCVSYYKRSSENPAAYAGILGDCQNPPIVDRSLPLVAGTIIMIPSRTFIQQFYGGDSLTLSPQM